MRGSEVSVMEVERDVKRVFLHVPLPELVFPSSVLVCSVMIMTGVPSCAAVDGIITMAEKPEME